MEKVESYIHKHKQWQVALEKLRKIMLESGLEEDYKWSLPVYTQSGKNIVGIGATKNHVGVWFFQGSLLKDESKVLVNAQEGKTKAMRQWRFSDDTEIKPQVLKAYVKEAMENLKAGRTVKVQRNRKLVIPPALAQMLKNNESLKLAFEKLGLSKRREFAEYIESAKQEKTKIKRLQKIEPMILSGMGLNDRYKKS